MFLKKVPVEQLASLRNFVAIKKSFESKCYGKLKLILFHLLLSGYIFFFVCMEILIKFAKKPMQF